MATGHADVRRYLAATGNRVLRPRDLHHVNPRDSLRKRARSGAVQALAPGYYLIIPDIYRDDVGWRPTAEGVALGVAVADYGRQGAALMGCSAARLHGAIPRALAVGVVAIPTSRPKLSHAYGTLRFVNRSAETRWVRVETDVVEGWMTSREQTVLDMADRPELGGVTGSTTGEAITLLAPRCDWELVEELAREQRRPAALARARWLAAAVTDLPPAAYRPRGLVAAKGLEPVEAVPAADFRIRP